MFEFLAKLALFSSADVFIIYLNHIQTHNGRTIDVFLQNGTYIAADVGHISVIQTNIYVCLCHNHNASDFVIFVFYLFYLLIQLVRSATEFFGKDVKTIKLPVCQMCGR